METIALDLLVSIAEVTIVFAVLIVIIIYLYMQSKKKDKQIAELLKEIRSVEKENLTLLNKSLAMFDKYGIKLESLLNLFNKKDKEEDKNV